jgi:transcriptional regulator with XRE-family HTH domain
MNALLFIRKHVLRTLQGDIAAITQVAPSTVSRWEAGQIQPNLDEIARLREACLHRVGAWDEDWLFDPPDPETFRIPKKRRKRVAVE